MRRCMIDVFSFPNIHMSFEFLSLLWKSNSQYSSKIRTLSQEILFRNTFEILTLRLAKTEKGVYAFLLTGQKSTKWQKMKTKVNKIIKPGRVRMVENITT
jgi:hypothetical protein